MISYKQGEHVMFVFNKQDLNKQLPIVFENKKPLQYKRIIIEEGLTKIVI
jgi:hypothetical protein